MDGMLPSTMKPQELAEYIEQKMRMSHIYQPVVIKALVDGGGSATIRQLAQAILLHDESQYRYYEKQFKKYPLSTLTKHGVIERNGDLVSLTASKLDFADQSRIRRLCEARLESFKEQRGLGIWDHRLGNDDDIPGRIRHKVRLRDKGKCQLCGITPTHKNWGQWGPFHIDHIKPRSKGGGNELSNLRLLCRRCNLDKNNAEG